MRAIFFCADALSVTWRDLAWGFLGGAMVAADAKEADSTTTNAMRRLQWAKRFIMKKPKTNPEFNRVSRERTIR
jgi:hypothetical protein